MVGDITISTSLLVIAVLVNLFLGVFVLFQNTRNRINQSFFYLAFFTGLWTLSNLIFIIAEPTYRLPIALLSYTSASFLACAFLNFAITITGSKWTTKKLLVLSACILSGFAALLPGIVGKVVRPDLSIETSAVGISLYAATVFLNFCFGMYILMRSYRVAKNKMRRNQVGIVMKGLIVAIIIGILCNLLLPLLGIYSYVQLGPLGTLVFVGASTYAIVRHGLFDIKMVAVRTAAYVASLAFVTVIYYVMAYAISSLFINNGNTETPGVNPLNIFLILSLAFSFQAVLEFFNRATSSFFYRDRYNIEDFYNKFGDKIRDTSDLLPLLHSAAREVATTLKAESAFFIIKNLQGKTINVSTGIRTNFPDNDLKTLEEFLPSNSHVIMCDYRDDLSNELVRMLKSHNISILIVLRRGHEALGYLCLGPHMGSGYDLRDKKALSTVVDELVIAIQNALSVQEVKTINANLKQRIEAATAELRTTNARLQRLDAAKDEFLSMASHQLRTPLTSVKGYLSMVLEGDVGKVTKMQRQVLEEAYSSSERMVHLIHDFLNVSRLQTGKFVLELQETDISNLIAEEVKSLERSAKSHNMTLNLENAIGPFVMTIDDTKIRQVVMNYVDNAIFYSHPDTTITVVVKKVDDTIVFTVNDTGIGVPTSEQKQLFEKFYRATNARRQRPDGTGVGIFLAKKIIDAHHGEVIFSSKEGVGSTFGFKLPIKRS